MNNVLQEVLTVREAAELFWVHPRTVRRAIDAKRHPIEGRKSPDTEKGVWLVTKESCLRRWGMSQHMTDPAQHRTSPVNTAQRTTTTRS